MIIVQNRISVFYKILIFIYNTHNTILQYYLFSIVFAMSTSHNSIIAFLIQGIVHFNQQVKDEEEDAAQV